MPEKPESLSFKQTLKMRKNYMGKSCKLHYEVAPLKMVRSSKQYMYDDSGNEYLDCINNVSHVTGQLIRAFVFAFAVSENPAKADCVIYIALLHVFFPLTEGKIKGIFVDKMNYNFFGHCHPHVVSAGQEQMSKLVTCTGFLSDCQVEYAKRLIETLPEDLCVCYFVNSGSEANDLALRLARAYTKNRDIICVENTYHGNTDNLLQVSPLRLKQYNLAKKDWVHIVSTPDTYHGKYREDTVNQGYRYAQEIKLAIQKAQDSGRRIAAFMSEPLMTAAGVVVPPPHYFQFVYRYVREAGGVCIADEVQTALGRTGEKFWAFQNHDVVPDIVTMGKPIGNGHPMAVVVTTKEISDNLFAFSSTFGGNPVACAMGIAVLDVIKNEQLVSSAKSVGKCLMDGFKAILPTHPMMGDVRGMGLVIGVEIVMDKESRKPAKEAAEILVYKLKEQKIMTNNDGPDKNVLFFIPPMCFTCENARTVVQAVDKTLHEIETKVSKVGLTSQTGSQSIEVPLDILTSSKPIHSLSDEEEDLESPSKRQRISYEEMD